MAIALRSLSLTILVLGLPLLVSCSHDSGGGSTSTVGTPIVTKVDEASYLNGRQFCETYKEVTSKEHGLWVDVPRDYMNPEAGKIQIYAYTLKPFDASKPSYVFVDGGPGQNTHGLVTDYLGGRVNEIRFDQRGLGCSAPETYALYRDHRLYSTENTIRDMEAIRKAYGIQRWAIHGVSYGTVPATMYGSRYPESTVSVVLEGVAARGELLHVRSYKVEKLNLVLSTLTEPQRQAFSELMFEQSPEAEAFQDYIFNSFYRENGLKRLQLAIQRIITATGKVDREILNDLRKSADDSSQQYRMPQQPGAVDDNILKTIYCKELDYRYTDQTYISYSHRQGFFESTNKARTHENDCEERGIRASDTRSYHAEDFPITAPVYYFQGSHDGATMARGAIEHWQKVPRGKSYFLLAQKGGHNPNLNRLDHKKEFVRQSQTALFESSVLGKEITPASIHGINRWTDPGQGWLLYIDPMKSTEMDVELEGIKKTAGF